MNSNKIDSNNVIDCGNGFRCLPVPKNRHDELLEHLKFNFFADEPLNKAVGLCKKGENHAELERYCLYTLAQKMSCMIVDQNDKVNIFFFVFRLL